MELAGVFALSVFSSYFLVIGALFWIILRSLPPLHPAAGKLKSSVFALLALGSFFHTWFCRFRSLRRNACS
jgi:hypothetical protein